MYELLIEFGGEVFALVVYGVGTLALSIFGLVAEYNGIQQFLSGDRFLAVWFAVMGLVALAFAVNLARDKLRPRLVAEN